MATKRHAQRPHEKLADLIKKRGLTLDQVAEALGVNRLTILSWKKGEAQPRYDRRLAIALWSIEPDSDGTPVIAPDEWMNEEELRLSLRLQQARQDAQRQAVG
jgi:transcriptional regulator with XRE-family HTH domain